MYLNMLTHQLIYFVLQFLVIMCEPIYVNIYGF